MLKETFVGYIEDAIKKYWDLPGLSDYEGGSITFGGAGNQIKQLHTFFTLLGIKKGDKISLIGRNTSNWAISYLATTTYGAVIVPLLQDFHTDDVVHLVTHSDSDVLIISENIFEKLDKSRLTHLKAIISLTDFTILYTSVSGCADYLEKAKKIDAITSPENFSFDKISNEELLGIIYTSGTSGFSKGVMLLHNSLATNIWFGHHNIDLRPGDNIVSFLPLAHAYGCAFEFLTPFTMGCNINFLGKIPSPQVVVKAFKELRPRLILSVPLIIEKIYKNQIKPAIEKPLVQIMLHLPLLNKLVYKKIRNKLNDVFGGNFLEVIIGGAALNKEVELFLRKAGFRFTVGYGMTECGPLITYAPWDANRNFSCGRPIPHVIVKINSSDPQFIPGEILVKGENVLVGYYKNPESTKDTIDEDGWMHTGDMGIIDNEGFVYIRGRSKNMILGASGQNIYPEEIEAKLNNMPFVLESLVIEKNGKLHAIVVPDKDLMASQGITNDQLELEMANNQKHLNSQLPSYMTISKVELQFEEFQKTPKKSIKRFLYLSKN